MGSESKTDWWELIMEHFMAPDRYLVHCVGKLKAKVSSSIDSVGESCRSGEAALGVKKKEHEAACEKLRLLNKSLALVDDFRALRDAPGPFKKKLDALVKRLEKRESGCEELEDFDELKESPEKYIRELLAREGSVRDEAERAARRKLQLEAEKTPLQAEVDRLSDFLNALKGLSQVLTPFGLHSVQGLDDDGRGELKYVLGELRKSGYALSEQTLEFVLGLDRQFRRFETGIRDGQAAIVNELVRSTANVRREIEEQVAQPRAPEPAKASRKKAPPVQKAEAAAAASGGKGEPGEERFVAVEAEAPDGAPPQDVFAAVEAETPDGAPPREEFVAVEVDAPAREEPAGRRVESSVE